MRFLKALEKWQVISLMSDSETKRGADDCTAASKASEATSHEAQAESSPAQGAEAMSEAPASELQPSAPAKQTAKEGTDSDAVRSTSADARADRVDAHKQKDAKDSRWLDRSTALWLGVVAIVFAVELFIYGHAGIIRVCVGLEGQTDFSLLNRKTADASPRSHPFCAERRNIGMYPNADEAARAALEEACQRGAVLTRGDQRACLRREKGWVRQVHKENVPPWDERVYRRLLWLD